MPTNLNALIRYKQIDKELSNPYLKSTILSLQEACSKQLAEHRGIYKLVSERTIRDDIRVMRSNALGFNAPIVVKDGYYSYDDVNYSIFNAKMNQMELLKQVLNLLIEEKENIKNSKLEAVMKALYDLTGIPLKEEETQMNKISRTEESMLVVDNSIKRNIDEQEDVNMSLKRNEDKAYFSFDIPNKTEFSWKQIFDLI